MTPLREQAKFSEPATAKLGKTRLPPLRGALIGAGIGVAAALLPDRAFLYLLLPVAFGAAGWFVAAASEQVHYQKEIIANLQSKLLHRAVIDETTELFNRDFFLKEAAREMERSKRYGRILAALLLDVKGFRRLNEERGNVVADGALRAVAEVLQRNVRKVDTLGRYGGDEFLVLLPGAKETDAAKVGERIRKSVLAKRLEFEGKAVPLDVDFRVIPCGAIAELDVLDLIEKADATIREMREEQVPGTRGTSS